MRVYSLSKAGYGQMVIAYAESLGLSVSDIRTTLRQLKAAGHSEENMLNFLAELIAEKLEKDGETPLVVLERLARLTPAAQPLYDELKELADKSGFTIHWFTEPVSFIARNAKSIFIDPFLLADRDHALALLITTVRHEISHALREVHITFQPRMSYSEFRRLNHIKFVEDEVLAVADELESAAIIEKLGVPTSDDLHTQQTDFRRLQQVNASVMEFGDFVASRQRGYQESWENLTFHAWSDETSAYFNEWLSSILATSLDENKLKAEIREFLSHSSFAPIRDELREEAKKRLAARKRAAKVKLQPH